MAKNEFVRVNFQHMEPAEEKDLKYVLIVRDDISLYTWPYSYNSADSHAPISILARCISCFGEADWHVRDRRSHFNTSFVNTLTTEIHIRHHFTTAC